MTILVLYAIAITLLFVFQIDRRLYKYILNKRIKKRTVHCVCGEKILESTDKILFKKIELQCLNCGGNMSINPAAGYKYEKNISED